MAQSSNIRTIQPSQNIISLVLEPAIQPVSLAPSLSVRVVHGGVSERSGVGWSDTANLNLAIIPSIKIQIFDHESAEFEPVYESTKNTRIGNLSGDRSAIGVYISANPPDEILTFQLPAGKLQQSKLYYWRALPIEVEAGYKSENKLVTNWGQTFAYESYTATNALQTTSLPVEGASFFIVDADDNNITEFLPGGGTVYLKWDAGKDAQSVFIESTPYLPNLGSQPLVGKTDGIAIQETTTFRLTIVNINGEYQITKRVVVGQSAPLSVNWNSTQSFLLDNTFGLRDSVVMIGEKYTVDVYTENMKNVGLYVYYPLINVNGTINSEKILASNILRDEDLIDADIVPTELEIKQPRQRSLFSNTYISGAWGYESVGKDNKVYKNLVGYFLLLNNTPEDYISSNSSSVSSSITVFAI